ncbi:hypothetical protein EK21DRAFT_114257 [Setomelanomma holmii]|uniref:Uncharacterized protein n=1 Tax=Setomelanomma holmii TaxID=210430 RepID=A0A9P4H5S4_9PLEO|nr:hypothetical protein EK21DRAFT_114257 [Setomelanomma holmii]
MADICAGCLHTIIWLGDYHETGADLGKSAELNASIYSAVHTYMNDREPGDMGDGWDAVNSYGRLKLDPSDAVGFDHKTNDTALNSESLRPAKPWLINLEAIRERTEGIGTLIWLQKLAESMRITDLRTAAYTFWASRIVALRGLDATNKRDKIFTTYGFLQKALAPLDIGPDARVTPD